MSSLSLVLFLAAALFSAERDGVSVELASETARIDPGRSVFVTLTLTVPRGVAIPVPDLRTRVRGFSLAEDFEEEPVTAPDGSVKRVVNWKLIPEPCAERYAIAPFAVGEKIVAGPVRFDPPAVRETVTGGIEADPKRDLPPLSWKLVGRIALGLLGLAGLLGLLIWAIRSLARRVKEHRMSPIERAWVELDRLLRKGLPGRGRYKDFYVELTMVVRRYVQRKYGIKAPHLTTEEFLKELTSHDSCLTTTAPANRELQKFLESADLVKFAGVEATPDMADAATESARGYLKSDDVEVKGRARDTGRETRETGRETRDKETGR